MSNKYTDLENDIQDLQELFKISSIVNQTIDIYDFINSISEYISETFDIKSLAFYVYENSVFKLVVSSGENVLDEYFEFDTGNDALLALLKENKIIRTFDENRMIFNEFSKNHNHKIKNTRYLAATFNKHVPTMFCFIGKNDDDEDLSLEQVHILQKIFSYIEPVLIKYMETKRKDNELEELQKSLYNISILYNISQAVNFIDDLKRLLQVILSKALVTLEAEKGSLMLYDYTSNSLQVKVVYGLPDKQAEENINNGIVECSKIKPGEGIAGNVFLEKKPIITNLGSLDPRFSQKAVVSSTKTLLCVPLIAKGEPIGVINITNKKNNKLFDQKDMEFVYSLANQAAIAIDNAKLYELATKDGLTKLYISRHFYTLLENELRRCTRYKHNMSLLMIDIDNFKSINDTYGHLVGDMILREISSVISETVRKIDTPARYGGEEFVVILPETTKDDALIIAERLRKNIEKIVVTTKDEVKIKATASFGIAEYPSDGVDAKTIIEASDKALYHSKDNGKNVVSIYYKTGCKLMRNIKNKKEELAQKILGELEQSE